MLWQTCWWKNDYIAPWEFLIMHSPWWNNSCFLLTYAVERVLQNVSESSSKCLPLVTNMNDLLSSLCGKHEIKSCPIWQGEWLCLVPARQFYYFKLFCHLRSCILRGLPVLGSCSRLIKMANARDESWFFLSNLAESGWIFKVQPQTCRHLQPTHYLSLIRIVWRWSNGGVYYRRKPCLEIKGRAVCCPNSQQHIYQTERNMSFMLLLVSWTNMTCFQIQIYEWHLKRGPVMLISSSTFQFLLEQLCMTQHFK